MYKKLLLATAVMGLTACGSSSPSDSTTDPEPNTGTDNTAAVIAGETSASIYYKDDVEQYALTISDADGSGEEAFIAQTDTVTTYGTFSITAEGVWTYEVEESEGLGDLESNESVTDTITIASIDGTEATITFTINSADAKPDDGEDPGDSDGEDDDDDPTYACEDAYADDGSGDASPVVTGSTTSIDADDLTETLKSVSAGDEIVITGGDSISIKDVCFAGEVLIRAETVGSVTLETASITRSQGITLQGFVFGPNDASTLLKVADSKNIKILRNTFDHEDVVDGQSSLVSTGNSEKITIAYNEFLDKNVITEEETGEVDGDGNPYYEINSGSYIKFQYDDDTESMTKEAHIHHNYFKNIEAYVQTGNTTPEGDSDREAIVFGDSGSQDITTSHVIEYNLFEDCDGENEIMTVKTSGNTFSHNTFLNSMGSLSFRLGHDNTAEYNYFYGTDADAAVQYFYGTTIEKVANYQTGGVRIYGENHIVRGNYMENLSGDTWRLPILVDSGDVSDSSNGNSHEAPTNALIEGNILVNNLNGGIQVGGDKYSIMPSSNTFKDNEVVGDTGNLYFSYAAGDANSWEGNTAYATDSAAVELDGANAGAGITLTDDELLIVSDTSTTSLTPLTAEDVGTAAGL